MKIELNTDQQTALTAIEDFLNDPTQDAFVLCGSAGTGKTTLVAKIIELAHSLDYGSKLVAPTGRAARILQGKLNRMLPEQLGPVTVSTLHGMIYYMSSLTIDDTRSDEGLSAVQMDFPIKKQGSSFDLLIVDEASMVGNKATYQSSMRFGSSRLLTDLVRYVQNLYDEDTAPRLAKLLFVGDLAQLPPVKDKKSPALSPEDLNEEFGIRARRYELTKVMRQADNSAILTLANALREVLFQQPGKEVQIPFNDTDLRRTDFVSAVQLIASNVRQKRSSIAVVYLNSTALQYNLCVRRHLWGNGHCSMREGDRLLVTRNAPELGVSNGDLVQLHSVLTSRHTELVCLPNGEFVELYFREVRLQTDPHRAFH